MHERLQASAFGHVLDMIMLLARNRAQAQMREPRVIMVAQVVQANVSRRGLLAGYGTGLACRR